MWLVQSNLINKNQQNEVIKTLTHAGIPFAEAVIFPFTTDMEVHGNLIEPNVITYGSTSLTKIGVARGYKGVYFDQPRFTTSRLVQERDDMLNQDADFVLLKDVREFLKNTTKYGDDPIFVKPNDDLKAFSGELIEQNAVVKWFDKMQKYNCVPDDQLVVISQPKNIVAEFRCFVVNGKIISTSQYKQNGVLYKENLDHDKQLVKYFQCSAEDWLPMSHCSMDFALMKDHTYKVVEFGCINCSGFYDHNIEKIVLALNETI